MRGGAKWGATARFIPGLRREGRHMGFAFLGRGIAYFCQGEGGAHAAGG